MATVQRPAERYVEFDEYIDIQLDKARNGIKWTDILAAVAGVAALVIGYLVAFVAADHWFFDGGVPRTLRMVALGVVAVVALLWIGAKVVWPYLRQVNDLYAARMLEESEPGLRGSLFGLVDLRRAGREPAEEVRRALEKRAAVALSDVDVDASLDRRPLLRTSYALLAVVLVACVYAVASPKRVGPSLARALFPTSTTSVATRTEIIEVKPGDVSVLAGTQLDVSVMIRGETPERVVLFYSTRDRRFADEPVELRLHDETTREYRAALIGDAGRGLTQDLTYRIEANDDAAGPFTVKVEQPPVATVTSITLRYPPYTGLKAAVRDTPPIDAIEGTTVTLAATANRRLKAAKLVFADDERFLGRGEEVPMRVADDGITLTANWILTMRSDGTSPTHYRIECRDIAGKSNPNPAVYPIAIRPDQPPEVVLHDPKSDLERPANAVIPLAVSARDPDFELRELTLRLERQGQELPERTVLWEGAQAEAKVHHDWELAPLGLKPGDVVTFYIQARDNREPEFNRRNTPKLNVTITEPVAVEQVEKQLAEDRERQRQELAEADRNAAAQERETQPAANDSNPMPPEETNDEPASEKGERAEAPEAGEDRQPGEMAEPSKGAGDEQTDSKVNNDGTADDVALRELLDHQRKQNGKSQPQPQNSDQQNSDQQKGDQQKGESESQRAGANSGDGQKQDSDRQNQPTGEASRQTPGEQAGKAGNDARDAEGNGGESPRDGNAGNRSPADPKSTGKPGRESEASDSEPSPNEENGGEGAKSSREMTERSNDGSTGESRTPAAADDSADRTEPSNSTSRTGTERTTEEQPKDQNKNAGNPGASSRPVDGDMTTDESQPRTGETSTSKPEGESSMQSEAEAGPMGEQSKTGDAESEMKSGGTGEKPMGSERRQPGTSDQPPGASPPQPGESNDSQQTPRLESGENGTDQPNVDGAPSEQPGQSDTGMQPGGTQPSGETSPKDSNAQPGDSSAQSEEMNETSEPGAASQPRDEKPTESSSESKTGESKSGESKSGESKSGEGKSGEGKSGEGKSGEGKSGEGKSGEGKSGEGKSGEGKSGEGKSGEGKSGEGKSGEGKSGEGKSGEGKSGEGQGKSGQQGQGAGGQAGKGGGGGTASGTSGSGGSDTDSIAEEANAAYTRQATDLALKKLEDELQRGEVDPKLLNELGWTEDDMRRFADRLRKNLAEPTGDESPQQIAERKEFEHMLENLQLDAGPAARTSPTGRVKDVGDVNTANPLVPSEYRDAYEAFTRSVAGRREAADRKK